MSDLSIRSRTVSELVDGAIALYRRDAMAYITVAAIMQAPMLVLQLALLGATDPLTIMLSPLGWILLLASMVTYALMNGAVMHMGSTVYLGGQADVATSVRHVLPRVVDLLLGTIYRTPLYFLGFLVFIFGFFYAFTRWFAVDAIVVLEEKGAWQALGRSTQLTRGRKRHVFNALFLGFIIYWVIFMGVGIVSAFTSPVVQMVLQTATTIVVYPTIALLMMLVYYDMRVREEAFDVQHLEASLGALPQR